MGQQQHGHIAAVGLDLYSQLLQEEITRLRGEPPVPTVRFPNIDLTIHAFLPAEYMPSEELRILFYKKLVAAESPRALEAIQQELEDRFGPLPAEAQTLLEVSRLRVAARDLGIAAVIQKPSSLEVQFLPNTPVPPQTLVQLSTERTSVRFRPGPPFTLQALPIAYETAGPTRYLESLFKDLAPRP